MSVRRNSHDAGDVEGGGSDTQPAPAPLWRNAEHDVSTAIPAYAVGDTVCSGDQRGTVHALGGDEYPNISVVWNVNGRPITYPADAPYLRKLFPWE